MITQSEAPDKVYQDLLQKHQRELSILKKRHSLIGWFRLVIVLITAVLAYFIFGSNVLFGYAIIAVGIALFLVAVARDVTVTKAIQNTQRLIDINKEELLILGDAFVHRYTGEDLIPALHDYANDLDIFGKASLFQWLNRCNSEQAKELLANGLLEPLPVAAIIERQNAVKELTPLVEWRQQLQAYSLLQPIAKNTQRRAESWLLEKEAPFENKAWEYIVPIYTIITLTTLVLTIIGIIPLPIFSPLFLIYFFISGSFSKKAGGATVLLDRIVADVETIYELMQWIENRKFQSPLLVRLVDNGKVSGENASHQIKNLKTLLGRFDIRHNILVFFLLNSFSLWDVRQLRALNKWKKKNKLKLSDWYETIAQFEVINSLAAAHFNKPGWCFPQFSEDYFMLKAENLGHPLIPENKKVTSSFTIIGPAKISLVTGSNMAGKSTFLRSLGTNIILAQLGAPVSASSFLLSPVKIMSSMRIADNLAENTSTFYAELKKLKTIIEAVNRHERVFILLDEILRGTNSLDRHTGSNALIKQLIKEKAVAVIATHDLELASMEESFPASIENYHFDVQVAGEELFFDYKLKEGVCTSLNASILMKKIGIDLE